jgi:hypothetical protein
VFDGTSWSTPAITGVTSSNLVNVNLLKTDFILLKKTR